MFGGEAVRQCFCSCLLSVLATGACGRRSSISSDETAGSSPEFSEFACDDDRRETEDDAGDGIGEVDDGFMVVEGRPSARFVDASGEQVLIFRLCHDRYIRYLSIYLGMIYLHIRKKGSQPTGKALSLLEQCMHTIYHRL